MSLWMLLAAYGIVSMVVAGARSAKLNDLRERIPASVRTGFALGFWAGLFLLCWVLSPAPEGRPFIYFQF